MSIVPVWRAQDAFNRADENPILSPWVAAPVVSVMAVTGNSAQPSSFGADAGAYWGNVNWGPDQYSRANITMDGTTTGASGVCLIVRQDPLADTFYRLVLNHAATNNVSVQRNIASAQTTPLILTQAWTDGDDWELRVQGATLTVLYKGAEIGSLVDTGIATGAPGIGYSSTATSGNLDNWEGGEFVYQGQAPNAAAVGGYSVQ